MSTPGGTWWEPDHDPVNDLLMDPAGVARVPAGHGGEPQTRTLRRRGPLVLAAMCMIAGLLLATSIAWFYFRSDRVGGGLVRAERQAIAASASSCSTGSEDPGAQGSTTTSGASGALQPQGILQAPAIGLTAPVVQGTGDTQLDVAVGHDPASAWPGPSGTMVLAAHDVTYFSQIDGLRPGDTVTFEEACHTYVYTVTGSQILDRGAPVPDTSTPTLVMVTCYPLDALFLTSQRYVVFARLTSVTADTAPAPTAPQFPPPPTVPAPAALAAQNLSLANNEMPLGTLQWAGSPSRAYQQSEEPLQVEASVLTLFFGLLRSAGQEQSGWWQQLAPAVPVSAAAPVADASVAGDDGQVVPTLDVIGDRVVGATLVAHPVLAGGPDPGAYTITMRAIVEDGDLLAGGWQMSPT